MNFLAHLHLANDTPASMVGNLMPDLVHGKLPPIDDTEVQHGIMTHRRVDAFTDTHPIFAKSKAHFIEADSLPGTVSLRHFSGILVDVYYDHFLSADWHMYHEMSLPEFIGHAYMRLHEGCEYMPKQMLSRMARIRDADYLSQYATTQGLNNVLTLMSMRFSERLDRNIQMQHSVPIMLANYQALREEFHAFYPQLMKYVENCNAETTNVCEM
ncbi:DUF479 domain-containing protein [Planctomycetota bacterium]|nr:DUF479 domain-containing protein [Planctomycetota bacterium]